MSLSEHLLKLFIVSIIVLVIDILWLSLFLGKKFGDMVLKIQNEEMEIK